MRLAPVALFAAALAAPALGCNSPVPATPDTAWVLNLSGGGAMCNLGNSVGLMGDINDTTIQTRVNDGAASKMGNASVTCTVSPSGAGFNVQASASQGGFTVNFSIPELDASASQATPAMGEVSYESAATATPYSGACKFYFTNKAQGVSAGKVWAVYSCDGITNAQASPPSTCGVGVSYFAFENCGTSM